MAIRLLSGETVAGNIRTGTSTLTANTNFDNLVIEGSAHTGITIFSGTSSDGAIYFGDSSAADGQGQIKYAHGSDAMTFTTNDGAASLTLDSGLNATFGGSVGINGGVITLGVADTSSGHINAYENMTFNMDIDNDDTTRYFGFYTNGSDGGGTELLKIEESGNATFAGDVSLADGKKLHFGDPSPNGDLQIYHEAGGNSYIAESGEGALVFKSDNYYFQDAGATATTMQIVANTGVTITGTIDANIAASGNNVIGTLNNTDYTSNNRSALKIRQQADAGGSWSAFLGANQDGTVFLSNDSITADHLTMDSSGNTTFAGNITLAATKTLKYADDKIKIGGTSNTPGAQGIQIGYAADSSGAQGIGMGYAANATGNQSIAMGYNPTASGTYSQAFGYNVTASGSGTVVFGTSGSHSDADTFVLSGLVLKSTGTGASTFAGDITITKDKWINIDTTWGARPAFGGTDDAATYARTIIRSIDNSANAGIDFQNYAGSSVVRILDGGEVGIGTTTPSSYTYGSNLVIVDTGSVGLTIQSNTTGVSAIQFADGDSGTAQYRGGIDYYHSSHANASSMVLRTNGTEKMRILSSYDTNLGSTQPPASRYSAFASYWIGGHGWIGGNETGGTSKNLVIAQNVNLNSSAAWTAIATDETNYLEMNAGNFNFQVSGSTTAGATPTWIQSLYLKNDGNVGIGTTSPSSYWAGGNNLVVYEAGAVGITIASSSASYEGSIAFADGTSGAEAYAGLIRYNHTSNYMEFYSNGTTRMRIDSVGNVGIGTTSPNDGKLQVQGSSTSWMGYFYNTNTSGPVMHLETAASGTQQVFRTSSAVGGSGNTITMVVLADGNVGIGTTSPDYKLEVESTADADLVSIKSTENANDTQMRLGISGDDSVISGTGGSTGNLVFKVYGSERMRITSTGSVTLTTTAASSIDGGLLKFNSSNSAAASYVGTVRFDGTHTPSSTIYTGPSVNAVKEDANYATALNFKTTNSVGTNNIVMTLDSVGRIQDTSGIYLGNNNNSNLLEQFHKTTWTPVLGSSSGTITSYTGHLSYVQRVGDVVTCQFSFTISDLGTAAGKLVISNLPIAIGSGLNDTCVGYGTIPTLGKSLNVAHYTATNQIYMYLYDGNFAGSLYKTVGTVTYWAAS